MAQFSLGTKARAAGYRLHAFDAVGSTNTEAVNAAKAGDPGNVWFAALQQTAGRGRRGRVWESPPGNLAASVLIRPEADPALSATLSFVAGIALNRAVCSLLPDRGMRMASGHLDGKGSAARIALKWPNDILADGAKLAGILLEAIAGDDGQQAVVIGFGVNVVAAPEDLPYPATHVGNFSPDCTAKSIFEALAESWVDCLRMWRNGQGTPDVLEEWRNVAAGVGGPVAVIQNGNVVRGIFETVDGSGRLIVRENTGRRVAITAGDVHFGATGTLAR